jgi:hypothetical protein
MTLLFVKLRSKRYVCKKNSKPQSTFLDETLVSRLMADCDWSEVTCIPDVNSSCCVFVNKLKFIISQATKSKNISSKYIKIKPWITGGLITSIRHRDKLGRELKQQPFNVALRDQYRHFRNTLSKLLKTAKETYFRNKIANAGSNSKKLWSSIKEITGLGRNVDGFPIENFLNGSDNIGPSDIVDIANTFNLYYVNVGASLAGAVPGVAGGPVNDANFIVNSRFELLPVTNDDLVAIINNIKGGSAPGIDKIPAQLIKKNIDILKIPLLYIINCSFLQGVFPNSLKVGKVVPIYKAGPRNQCISYRPINLVSVISKIIEKAVRLQLEKYLINNNILYKNQFGFRRDKNLNDNLFLLTKQIHESIECNKKVLLAFIDLAKAFDTIDRGILLKKLECIGVRGISLRWFENYFSGRTQVVSILDQVSVPMGNDYGVIQGSSLGPILFLIYINNLGRVNIDHGHLFLYADDTAILFEGSSWEEVFRSAELGLVTIKKWFDHNRLTMNLNKTKYLPIAIRANGDPIGLDLRLHTCGIPNDCTQCDCIECVCEYKYLGIIFDCRLKWSSHVQYTRNKLRKFIYVFSTLSRILTPSLMKQVYYAYIQSILQYGIIAWGGAYKTILNPLSIAQKLIIKSALRKPQRYPTDTLFEEFNVLNVSQLYIRTLVLYIFKHKSSLFSNICHNYNTRSALNIGIINPRLIKTFTTTSTHYKINILYRKLPEHIKNPTNGMISHYKKVVNEWMSSISREELDVYVVSPYSD